MKNNTNVQPIILGLILIAAKDASANLPLAHYTNTSMCPANNLVPHLNDMTNVAGLDGMKKFSAAEDYTSGNLKGKNPTIIHQESDLDHDVRMNMMDAQTTHIVPEEKSVKSDQSAGEGYFAWFKSAKARYDADRKYKEELGNTVRDAVYSYVAKIPAQQPEKSITSLLMKKLTQLRDRVVAWKDNLERNVMITAGKAILCTSPLIIIYLSYLYYFAS